MQKLLGTSLALLPVTLVLGGCSGSGGSGSGAGAGTTTGSADLLVTSSGSTELFALEARIEEVHLVDDTGRRSPDLLAQPTDVEFVGQEGSAAWLTRSRVEPGPWTTLEVTFDPDSVVAVDETGARTSIPMESDTHAVPLTSELLVQGGSNGQLLIDLDVTGSIVPNSGGGPSAGPTFEPDFLVVVDAPRRVERLVGTVGRVDPGASVFDLENAIPGGATIEVQVADTTDLVAEDGSVFAAEAAFFGSLLPGRTKVEVTGVLQTNGTLVAERARIREHGASPGADARIEGMVLWVDRQQDFFVFLVRDVKEGEAEVRSALAAIGSPRSFEVDYDADTEFLYPDGTRGSESDLAVGQVVEVVFTDFSSPPFLADRVELSDFELYLSARITDLSGLPDEMVVRLDDGCSVVRGGRVFSKSTDVVVDLRRATLRLSMRGMPEIGTESLSVGDRVRLCGSLGGTPRAPTFRARFVDVKPGHLIKGRVDQPRPRRSLFVVAQGQIVQGFGSEVAGLPATVRLHPDARYLQEASSEAELFRVLASLDPDDEYGEVKVKGIQSGTPGEILAFEVKLKTREERGGNGKGRGEEEEEEEE